MEYLYENHFATIDVLKNALLALPLPVGSITDRYFRVNGPLAEGVERMLALHKQLGSAHTPYDRENIKRQIEPPTAR